MPQQNHTLRFRRLPLPGTGWMPRSGITVRHVLPYAKTWTLPRTACCDWLHLLVMSSVSIAHAHLHWLVLQCLDPSSTTSISLCVAAMPTRRAMLAGASQGSRDIRTAFRSAASASVIDLTKEPAATSAKPTSRTLTPLQEATLLQWPEDSLRATCNAWMCMDDDPPPLLLQANLQLLPAAFVESFELQLPPHPDGVQEVREALAVATAWLDLQQAELTDLTTVGP